jgi:hypothetical protein
LNPTSLPSTYCFGEAGTGSTLFWSYNNAAAINGGSLCTAAPAQSCSFRPRGLDSKGAAFARRSADSKQRDSSLFISVPVLWLKSIQSSAS